MKYQAPLLIAGLAALAGCSGKSTAASADGGYKPVPVATLESVPYKEGEEELLFPMKVGNSWTYEVNVDSLAKGAPSKVSVANELILRCTNVVQLGDQTRATIEAVMDGKVNERQIWILNKKGLYQESVGQPPKMYTPPQPAWLRPLKQDSTFKWAGFGFVPDGTMSGCETLSKVIGMQPVDTGLGRVQAMTVQSAMKWANGRSLSQTWWAPKIGIVRYRQEAVTKNGSAVQVMRLKSKVLK